MKTVLKIQKEKLLLSIISIFIILFIILAIVINNYSINAESSGKFTTLESVNDQKTIELEDHYTNISTEISITIPQQILTSEPPRVRVIYMIPSNKQFNQSYKDGLEKMIKHLQFWYWKEIGTGKSFRLHNPIVEVVTTNHASNWYAETARTGDRGLWFWFNVFDDAHTLVGSDFYQNDNTWLVFIDADPGCNQLGGAGGGGFSLLPANGLRTLSGQSEINCSGQSIQSSLYKSIGGVGHELGHAFYLPHGPCWDGDPATQCNESNRMYEYFALMYIGYLTYPRTYFSQQEKNTLNQSSFFTTMQFSPPTNPVISSPQLCIQNTLCTFRSISTDPNNKQIRYEYEWDPNNFNPHLYNTSINEISGTMPSESADTRSHYISRSEAYTIKVRSVNIDEIQSNFSEYTFTIIDPQQQRCQDSDGKNYFLKGNTIYNGRIYTDSCTSIGAVEYSCTDEKIDKQIVNCSCFDGACT